MSKSYYVFFNRDRRDDFVSSRKFESLAEAEAFASDLPEGEFRISPSGDLADGDFIPEEDEFC